VISNETAVDASKGIVYHARIGEGRFEIVTGLNFKEGMLNPLKIKDGRTIAKMRRDELHKKLDEWLDTELGIDDGK
jgi:hypothetical protein